MNKAYDRLFRAAVLEKKVTMFVRLHGDRDARRVRNGNVVRIKDDYVTILTNEGTYRSTRNEDVLLVRVHA